MISAGNDIIALKAVDLQRTQSPTFYSKFITEAELALYEHSALPFATFVWILWSVKESTFKYFKRFDSELVFSPTKIIVEQLTLSDQPGNEYLCCDTTVDSCFAGIVVHNDLSIYFSTIVNDNFIATTINCGRVYWGVKNILVSDYKSQSDAVRLFALDKLSGLMALDNLWIDKHEAGYPLLMHNQHPIDIPLSFAHHGSFVSYSFQIPK